MNDLELNCVYEIELCSGEIREWRFMGQDQRSLVWWQDVETGREFNEASLMYAWKTLRKIS